MGFGMQRGPLAAVSPALSLTGGRTSARSTEATFLDYSEMDVEQDLIRIIQLLGGIQGPAARRRRRFRRERRRLLVHPVIVLDEVDKLTDNSDEALGHLENLLGTLKNVLTTRGAYFIPVAGPDLHDQALRDADRGNGVYESVFSWRMYVRCLWAGPERLVRGLVDYGRAETVPAPAMRSVQPGRSVTWRPDGLRRAVAENLGDPVPRKVMLDAEVGDGWGTGSARLAVAVDDRGSQRRG
ncbi:hypothetical protein [Streptomyces sp. NPDC096013]|uniref:hypothetical protein n=1 Tax=Streptomyces sp. NPDC096013 TaxID=3366069 RepID=UPI00382F6F6D